MVQAAYEIALEGDIHDESDPASQAAREMLREELTPALRGFEAASGIPMQLHFHLPSNRSLVRLWREQQIRRDGVWMDVSDDLSFFRPSVIDVNRTGQPVTGIEVGQGGFVVRGLAPVRDADGQHIGSVEMLANFDEIIQSVADAGQSFHLYMNKEHLDVAGRLQDPERNPLLFDRFVWASGTDDDEIKTGVSLDILEAGAQGLHIEHQANRVVAAFPVTDYRDQQVGIMVMVHDTQAQDRLFRTIYLAFAIGGILILVVGVLSLQVVLGKVVTQPLQAMMKHISLLAKGNFSAAIDEEQLQRNDEIGAFFHAIAGLQKSLSMLLQEIAANSDTMAAAATQLSTVSSQTANGVRTMSERTSAVAAAAEESSANTADVASGMSQTSTNLSSVASATEEMSATIGEVASSSAQARTISLKAAEQAATVSSMMKQLGEAAEQIGNVTETITDISSQTNLLALNATIEAARAGAAGKGFAVVANEIKELAEQTATATEDIKGRISGVQSSAAAAIEDITRITSVIEETGQLITGIDHSIDQQSMVTRDVAGHIARMSTGVDDSNERVAQIATVSRSIAKDIADVNQIVGELSDSGQQVHSSATELSRMAEQIRDLLQRFKM